MPWDVDLEGRVHAECCLRLGGGCTRRCPVSELLALVRTMSLACRHAIGMTCSVAARLEAWNEQGAVLLSCAHPWMPSTAVKDDAGRKEALELSKYRNLVRRR